jgi:hypothetical protein
VFNILEDSLVVCLANAEDVKGRKGHKTDRRDAKWLLIYYDTTWFGQVSFLHARSANCAI